MADNTDPEREAWELLNAQYADGWTTRYGSISGDGAVRAITTALRQRDEARARLAELEAVLRELWEHTDPYKTPDDLAAKITATLRSVALPDQGDGR